MINIKDIAQISKKAGNAIMQFYDSKDMIVVRKNDHSPLTQADKVAHQIILESLHHKYPNIPILSEEGLQHDYAIRKKWSQYWIVDPLDGTKEFIRRNGEFTVNIALIENNRPVLGVIHAPVHQETYIGSARGAFKQKENKSFYPIHAVSAKRQNRIAVQSRSHPSSEEQKILQNFGVCKTLKIGSSLKFCMVAEGKADIYYRQNPTMEWDTAAGQAIATFAGAQVFQGNTTEKEFYYNKKSLVNRNFLCISKAYLDLPPFQITN